MFENFEALRRIGWCFSNKNRTIRNRESSCFFGLLVSKISCKGNCNFSRLLILSRVNSRLCNSRWISWFSLNHRVYAFSGKNISHLSHSSTLSSFLSRRFLEISRFETKCVSKRIFFFFFFLIKRTTQS